MTLTTPYLYPERSMVEDLKLMFRAVIPFSHCRPKTSRLLSKHHDLLSKTQRTWNSFWNLNCMISLPTSTIQSFGPNFRTSLIVRAGPELWVAQARLNFDCPPNIKY